MLKVNNIKKAFYGNTILGGISFTALKKKLTILEGQNGAGKSTLFNIISGVLPADEGEIFINDTDVTLLNAQKRANYIGILKQDPKSSSVPSLSIADNMVLAGLKKKTSSLKKALTQQKRQEILEHLRYLKLSFENLDQPMGMLSGGQRQILAFAMLTFKRPDLILLDEPTAALDEESSHKLMMLIKYFVDKWDIPALMISHDHELNKKYGDNILVLKDGLIKG